MFRRDNQDIAGANPATTWFELLPGVAALPQAIQVKCMNSMYLFICK